MKIFPFEHLDGMSILANNDNACFFVLVFTINNLFRLLSLTGLITLERFPPGGRIQWICRTRLICFEHLNALIAVIIIIKFTNVIWHVIILSQVSRYKEGMKALMNQKSVWWLNVDVVHNISMWDW